MAEEDLVTLATCEKLAEADLVRSKLDAAGIPAFIPDEKLMQNIAFNLNTFGYVRVQVRRQNYAEAKELLSAAEAEAARPQPEAAPATADGKRVIASLAAGQVTELLEHLKQAGIPVEARTVTEESGLEMTEILADQAVYDRGCDAVEAWSNQKQAEYEKRTARWCPHCGSHKSERIPHETLGYVYKCKDCGQEFPE